MNQHNLSPAPWISVIIPTWNGSGYLNEALTSISMQNEDSIEIIVIDDGSTDQTVDIVRKYANSLPIRLVNRDHTGNWVTNTNIGLSMVSGTYVTFLHQDDTWLPERLTILRRLTNQYPEIGFFFHPSFFIDAESVVSGMWNCPLPRVQTPLLPSFILPRLLIQNFLSVSAVCFKRHVLDHSSMLDDRLWYTADWNFWISLVSRGASIYFPEPLSCFRIHPLSQTMQRSVDLDAFKSQMQQVLNQSLPLVAGYDCMSFIKAAQLSIEVNTALAGLAKGELSGITQFLKTGVQLNPFVWRQYLNYSGIINRCRARIKTTLWRRENGPIHKNNRLEKHAKNE